MNTPQYESKVVKILDAQVEQELGDKYNAKFVQTLKLLLQDVEAFVVFQTTLSEEDLRKIVRSSAPLTSKQLIDISLLLRDRQEPLRLMVPVSSTEVTVNDILKDSQPAKRKRKRRNRKKVYQNANSNRKIN